MKGRCSSDTSPIPQALCASPTDTVGECLRLMHEKIYRHLPVLGPDDQPLGILNIRDLLKPLQPIAAGPPQVGMLDSSDRLHTVTYRYIPSPTVTYRYIPLHTVTYRSACSTAARANGLTRHGGTRW